jgi:hypothetical protein
MVGVMPGPDATEEKGGYPGHGKAVGGVIADIYNEGYGRIRWRDKGLRRSV